MFHYFAPIYCFNLNSELKLAQPWSFVKQGLWTVLTLLLILSKTMV